MGLWLRLVWWTAWEWYAISVERLNMAAQPQLVSGVQAINAARALKHQRLWWAGLFVGGLLVAGAAMGGRKGGR